MVEGYNEKDIINDKVVVPDLVDIPKNSEEIDISIADIFNKDDKEENNIKNDNIFDKEYYDSLNEINPILSAIYLFQCDEKEEKYDLLSVEEIEKLSDKLKEAIKQHKTKRRADKDKNLEMFKEYLENYKGLHFDKNKDIIEKTKSIKELEDRLEKQGKGDLCKIFKKSNFGDAKKTKENFDKFHKMFGFENFDMVSDAIAFNYLGDESLLSLNEFEKYVPKINELQDRITLQDKKIKEFSKIDTKKNAEEQVEFFEKTIGLCQMGICSMLPPPINVIFCLYFFFRHVVPEEAKKELLKAKTTIGKFLAKGVIFDPWKHFGDKGGLRKTLVDNLTDANKNEIKGVIKYFRNNLMKFANEKNELKAKLPKDNRLYGRNYMQHALNSKNNRISNNINKLKKGKERLINTSSVIDSKISKTNEKVKKEHILKFCEYNAKSDKKNEKIDSVYNEYLNSKKVVENTKEKLEKVTESNKKEELQKSLKNQEEQQHKTIESLYKTVVEEGYDLETVMKFSGRMTVSDKNIIKRNINRQILEKKQLSFAEEEERRKREDTRQKDKLRR